ncbi:amidase [Pseudomonas synxantha]|nr:amidase [Pseudomonas synxantha]
MRSKRKEAFEYGNLRMDIDWPDLCELDSATLLAAYKSRHLSPVDVVRAALDRCIKVQDALNAFTYIDFDGALTAAKASEKRWRNGKPLSLIDGIPTTLKDIFHVEGWSVRYGSMTTPGTPNNQDAPSVSRLREAGAVFIGQTAAPEYSWKTVTDSPAFGVTRNPWDPTCTPGGSSGGAAVAAACGAGVLHLGTDGGGSIRIPASFTGVFGLKPSHGRVPVYPPSSFGTVAHIGPITRTVADAAAMLRVLSGRDLRDWTQPPMAFPNVSLAPFTWRGKRIGYWRTPCIGNVDGQVATAIEATLVGLEAAGASVTEMRLPYQDELLEMYNRHWYIGAANLLTSISTRNHANLDPGLLRAATVGRRYSGVERLEAEVWRNRYGSAMDNLLSDFDFIMSPSVPILPFEVGRDVPRSSDAKSWTEWCSFSFPINLSQQPACSVPCGLSKEGLPIGLQIIGSRGADSDVLSAALCYERAFPDRLIRLKGAWRGIGAV